MNRSKSRVAWKAKFALLGFCAVAVLTLAARAAGQGNAPSNPPTSAQDNAWMNAAPASTGIAVGQKIPAFSLPDQNGRAQTFDSIKGPNGAVIYFNRSVDW